MHNKPHSEETKRKMRLAAIGRKSPMEGKKHSKKSIEKMKKSADLRWSDKNERLKQGEVIKQNIKKYGHSKGMLGKRHSISTKKKMSEKRKGILKSKEWRNNMKGEGNPSWLGGKSFEPYSINWTDVLKESIRLRDNYTCQIKKCGAKQKKRKLPVHHIDYDKQNSTVANLILLCNSCHKAAGLQKGPIQFPVASDGSSQSKIPDFFPDDAE